VNFRPFVASTVYFVQLGVPPNTAREFSSVENSLFDFIFYTLGLPGIEPVLASAGSDCKHFCEAPLSGVEIFKGVHQVIMVEIGITTANHYILYK